MEGDFQERHYSDLGSLKSQKLSVEWSVPFLLVNRLLDFDQSNPHSYFIAGILCRSALQYPDFVYVLMVCT